MARNVAYTEPISRRVSSASGLLNRNISTATGVSARMAPANRPAHALRVVRRTVAYSSPTEPTPISACGTSMLHDDRPNRRTDSSIGQNDSGVLSTVIELAASDEPKK